jgi:hypothetical protein
VLDQLRDFLDILHGVEEAAVGGPSSAIVWRVVQASRNSPLTFAIEAFPKIFGVNIDQRVDTVVRETAAGYAILRSKPERPKHFNDELMKKAERTFGRVTNGIGAFVTDFGSDLPKLEITPSVARTASRNVRTVLTSFERRYQEIGSIDGFIKGVEVDGRGRRVAFIRDRMTGSIVKCIIPRSRPELADLLAQRYIGDVWSNVRVEVSGLIHYVNKGSIDYLDAEKVRFFKKRSELPRFQDIVDPSFTGGLLSEEYLERIRNDTLSQ